MATYTYKTLTSGMLCAETKLIYTVPISTQCLVKQLILHCGTSDASVDIVKTTGVDLKGTIVTWDGADAGSGCFEDVGGSAVTIGAGYTNTNVTVGKIALMLAGGAFEISAIANGGAGASDVTIYGIGVAWPYTTEDLTVFGIFSGVVIEGITLTQYSLQPCLLEGLILSASESLYAATRGVCVSYDLMGIEIT